MSEPDTLEHELPAPRSAAQPQRFEPVEGAPVPTTPETVGRAPAGPRWAAPADLSPAAVHQRYLLHLGDDALVYSQRLGEWISRAPQIEEDMALGNIGLDLLGQARALLSRAGELEPEAAAGGGGVGTDEPGPEGARVLTEDDLAYFRDEQGYRNVQLVELPRGHFGVEMARLLWFSAYQYELYARLAGLVPGTPASSDETLAGVARKAVKEVEYHRDHAAQWVLRLGDGTQTSAERMTEGLQTIAPCVDELFADDAVSLRAAQAGLGVAPSSLRKGTEAYVRAVVEQATLAAEAIEPAGRWRASGGREGRHSSHMGYLLAEMQSVARAHPGATW